MLSPASPSSLQCSLTGTGCLTKTADQCSCQACINSYRHDNKGGCTKVGLQGAHVAWVRPGLQAGPIHVQHPPACTAGVPCTTCALPFQCLQCAGIVNCAAYSTTDCKCTACKPYFAVAGNGTSCQVRAGLVAGPWHTGRHPQCCKRRAHQGAPAAGTIVAGCRESCYTTVLHASGLGYRNRINNTVWALARQIIS